MDVIRLDRDRDRFRSKARAIGALGVAALGGGILVVSTSAGETDAQRDKRVSTEFCEIVSDDVERPSFVSTFGFVSPRFDGPAAPVPTWSEVVAGMTSEPVELLAVSEYAVPVGSIITYPIPTAHRFHCPDDGSPGVVHPAYPDGSSTMLQGDPCGHSFTTGDGSVEWTGTAYASAGWLSRRLQVAP